MTSTSRTSFSKRLAATCAILGLATVGIASAPTPANAWWHHGYGYGYCCGFYSAPVIIAPAPVYAPPPPVYYAPPQRVWIPAHWQNGYWVQGHWD